MSDVPLTSIVIATRNEEQFIGKCLDSIVYSDFPQDQLEILVVDGNSTDKTKAIVEDYARRFRYIRLLSNPRGVTPVAFNIGVDNARGELIMIMCAHSTYDRQAIRKCVEYSRMYGADNVGGIWIIRSRHEGLIATAIVAVLGHPFGVGNALYRTTRSPKLQWVDTAAFGCYRREVFERVGKYNERLLRSQDIEFNLRLKQAGGRTLLATDVVITYFARTDMRSFCHHSFQHGLWVVMAFAHSTVIPARWRHLTPLAFVAALLGSLSVSLAGGPLIWPLLVLLTAYIGAAVAASLHIARQKRQLLLAAVLPAIFMTLHISYGLGSIVGCTRLVRLRGWRNVVELARRSVTIP